MRSTGAVARRSSNRGRRSEGRTLCRNGTLPQLGASPPLRSGDAPLTYASAWTDSSDSRSAVAGFGQRVRFERSSNGFSSAASAARSVCEKAGDEACGADGERSVDCAGDAWLRTKTKNGATTIQEISDHMRLCVQNPA